MNATPTKKVSKNLETVGVFGLPFAVADYEAAFECIIQLAQENRPTSVVPCATHPITKARLDAEFREVLASFDLRLPDGMPVVWMMNAHGARLRDRVYGPYLMRYIIERSPHPYRHFLFGGSPECLSALEASLSTIQPALYIAGTLSPPFHEWSDADEDDFAQVIAQADADFIWVALGGVKQETWIARNRHRYARGVFLAVGDAFELLAGRRAFAPGWIQRAGLTWVYRFGQEPGRLWRRYVFYNSAFAAFALFELLREFTRRLRHKDARS